MASYKYAFTDYDKDTMARCALLAASVSTKHCIEICNHIRGRKVVAAKKILNEAMELKKAIPFKRFNHNMGHKKKIGPGRYPVKACTEILKAIDSCEANAQGKGFNTSELVIKHICANMASRPWHYGRARRRKTKRTHIELVLEEAVKEKKGEKPEEKALEKAEVEKASAIKKEEKSPVKKVTEKKEEIIENEAGTKKKGSAAKPMKQKEAGKEDKKTDIKPASAKIEKPEAKKEEKKQDKPATKELPEKYDTDNKDYVKKEKEADPVNEEKGPAQKGQIDKGDAKPDEPKAKGVK